MACVAPDGRLLAANPALCEMVGRTEQELSGVGFLDLTHPDDREGYLELLGSLRRGRIPSFETRSRCLRGSGSPIWVQTCVSAVTDELGEPEYLVALVQDVTEGRSAEEQTARLFGFPLALVFIAGLDGYFKRLGAGYERLLGWTEQELLSRPFFEFVHPDDLATLGGAIQEVAAGRAEVINQEIRALCKDGTYRWLMGNYRPVLDEGVMYGMAIDITERKSAEEALRVARAEAEEAREEAERASRAKSEFLSRMSHELRTPLNAILGFAQLLEIDDLGPDHGESVEQILRAGRHLLQLIEEVLDVARIEQGRLSLSIEPVHLDEVVREVLDLVRPSATPGNIRFRAETSQLDRHVLADRQRLKQVLMNLLSNAVKYNRQGGTVTVSCGPTPEGRKDRGGRHRARDRLRGDGPVVPALRAARGGAIGGARIARHSSRNDGGGVIPRRSPPGCFAGHQTNLNCHTALRFVSLYARIHIEIRS